ncbi:class F sortase [Actinoplanes sp. NPDC049265]|uniref:class F sortase n=1 Tax=Actinoplanes sp. NPDC049265 TaxID=3363902 RepID=UPI00371E96FD
MSPARLPESVRRKRPAEIVVPRQRPPEIDPPARPPAHPPPAGDAPRPQPPAGDAPPRRRFPRVPKPGKALNARGRRLPIGWIAGGLVFLGLFGVGMGLGNATVIDIGGWFRGPDKPPPRAFPVLEPSRPLRLTIPSIKVEAPILEVGLAKDGSVDVPPLQRHNEAGWFGQGPTPGQFGPALIVGHADTRTGPSVFHSLAKLKPGQVVEVLRDDREVAQFTVNSVENYGKAKLPIKRVYGDYSRPSLRLVTCGGEWLGGSRGYSDNIVVFASLTGTRKR